MNDLETKQLCTFSVDGVVFGVDVKDVQEVIRQQPMTPVPLAPPVVRGLINLRGQIVTALDLRKRLGLAERDDEVPPMNVIIRAEESVVSLLVDEIGDVIEVEAESFEPAPESLDPPSREIIDGIYKTSRQLVLVLSTDKASSISFSEYGVRP